MHPSLDRNDLIALAPQEDWSWIGLFGSAAGEGLNYRPSSDIDLIALGHGVSRFAYASYRARAVEISIYSHSKLEDVLTKPHWFGTNWVWEVGKFACAEDLFGIRPDISPLPEARLTAVLGVVGKIQLVRRKGAQVGGLELTALKHLVHGTWPARYETDSEGFYPESVDQLAPTLSGLLAERLSTLMYFPEHRAGAKWLIERWALGIRLPTEGAPI